MRAVSAQTDGAWMIQQARNVAMHFADLAVRPTLLLPLRNPLRRRALTPRRSLPGPWKVYGFDPRPI
jgi:hypothetical protein